MSQNENQQKAENEANYRTGFTTQAKNCANNGLKREPTVG